MHHFTICIVTNETAKMCDPWESREFLQKIDLMPDGTCEYCLPDCSTTIYDHEVSSAPIRHCDHTNLESSYMCQVKTVSLKQNINPPPFVNNILSQFTDNSQQVPQFVTEIKMFSNMRYRIKESKIPTAVFRYKVKDKPTYNAFEEDIAIVNFYFDKDSILQYTRQESMTTVGYISQLGGILGLFIGFSFVSGIELIYWFTIRLYKNNGIFYKKSRIKKETDKKPVSNVKKCNASTTADTGDYSNAFDILFT